MGRRKDIRNLAYGLLHTFVSRYNDDDGYWALGKLHALAQAQGSTRLAFDLWGNAQADTAAIVSAMRARYGDWLRQGLRRHRFRAGDLQRAIISMDFEREDLRRQIVGMGSNAPPMVCAVTLVDALGREYGVQTVLPCRPHDAARESRGGAAASACGSGNSPSQ
jgi:hypothetical protein